MNILRKITNILKTWNWILYEEISIFYPSELKFLFSSCVCCLTPILNHSHYKSISFFFKLFILQFVKVYVSLKEGIDLVYGLVYIFVYFLKLYIFLFFKFHIFIGDSIRIWIIILDNVFVTSFIRCLNFWLFINFLCFFRNNKFLGSFYWFIAFIFWFTILLNLAFILRLSFLFNLVWNSNFLKLLLFNLLLTSLH